MSRKQEFADWKSHPITKVVFDALREREVALLEILGTNAGENPLQDRYHAGYIAAVRDLYLTSAEDIDKHD